MDDLIFNSFFNYTFICKKLVSELRRFGTTEKDGRTIYGFRQEGKKGLWKYIGLLKVIGWEYVPKNGFNTYIFKLKKD